MSNHQSEVRSRYARAVAEYRVAIPCAMNGFNRVGHWAIVVPGEIVNKLLGRGDTEAAAWEVAALAGRLERMLVEFDRETAPKG